MTIILASSLPILSIVLLYYVHSMTTRLGLIGVCNLLVSVCLGAFTKANRAEIFAVTAA
jgi:hypothetical protein